MFTGLVEATGRVCAVDARDGDARLTIESDGVDFSKLAEGASIAVSGVCLTALDITDSGFSADVSRETLAVTTLGSTTTGDAVNLERSLALGDPLGGHLVTGHVDCTGRIAEIESDARSTRMRIALPGDYARYIARKGSVAVDGISLTVNGVRERDFDVNVIPHTLSVTTLNGGKVGTRVNIEVDLIARYLERLAGTSGIDT